MAGGKSGFIQELANTENFGMRKEVCAITRSYLQPKYLFSGASQHEELSMFAQAEP